MGDIGLVQKNSFTLPHYTTVSGKTIKDVKVGWEAYGKLNEAKDNVILVPHFFSSNSHAAGRYKADDPLPGYWDSIIGPGKAIDTNQYFVISVDSLVNMNSKDGITVTTGPASINPDTGKPYGMTFPVVTIRDFVRVQKALIDSLGIKKLHAAAGTSMGGLQSFEWAAAYPEMVGRVLCVDGTVSQRPFAVLGLESWIAPIKADPNWNNGDYYGGPEPLAGLSLAYFNVMVAAVHPEWSAELYGFRWADPERSPMDSCMNEYAANAAFKAGGVLRATNATDANNMLYMTRANQLFVAGTPGSSVAAGLVNIKARTLMVQARTDLLFPPEDTRAQVAQLKANGTDAEYVEIDTGGGHLAGITDVAKVGDSIRSFLAAA
ncbi:homoserine O-acetyltransferase [soil metagenome]